MLLRSSSTPILGSLLESRNSNNNNIHHFEASATIKHQPTTIHQNHSKLSLHQAGSLKLSSCNSSPISPSVVDIDRSKGFRRAQSDGNLEGLAGASCNGNEDQFSDMSQHKRFRSRPMCLMLQTIPSFRDGCEDDEEEEDESDVEDDEDTTELDENDELSGQRGEGMVTAVEAQTLNSENKTKHMNLREEVNTKDEIWNLNFADAELLGQKMFLARGLAVGCGGSGGRSGNGREFNSVGSSGDGSDNPEAEKHYKTMVEENPGNPLFLRNYAQFLYEIKRELGKAEGYYSRAILADPMDGEILSQYAKLVWELHHDQERACSYFERAVKASPQDSHVHAAYARFLWETEELEDECDAPHEFGAMPLLFHAAVASASA